MTDNLFEGNPDDLSIDPSKNYLDELIGPGGKFYDEDREKALQKLARGKVESDLTVRKREQSLDELREDFIKTREQLNQGQDLKQLIDQLAAKTLASEQPEAEEVTNKVPSITLEDVENVAYSKYQEFQSNSEQKKNFEGVKSKLIERFGPNYQSKVKEQIQTLGITEEFFNDLAKKHPTVAIKTLGLDGQQRVENFDAPPRNQRRPDSFAPSGGPKRTWSYYEDMRRTKPELYHNPKTQQQMHADFATLGEEFKDGTWRDV